MTKEDTIRAIAHKHWEIRRDNELPGSKSGDWLYATQVYNFFADVTAPRNSEWDMKMEDYEPYLEIYEQGLWVI